MKSSLRRFLSVCSLVAFLAAVPILFPEYYVGLSSKALVLAVLAMSVNLLLGYLGLASLGQAAFAGISSYVLGILTLKAGVGPWLAIGGALLASVVVGAAFGLLAVRTRDVFFLVIMLAFSQVLYGFSTSLRSLTGGEDGLPGLMRPDLFSGISLGSTTGYYFAVAVVFLVLLGAFHLFVNSPFGLALKGIRDSESRMRVLGYNVWLHRYLGFLASALVGGVAGVLIGYLDGCPNPKDLGVIRSSTALLMVILGGPGRLVGPLVGAVTIVFLEDLTSSVTDRWVTIMGFVYIAVVLLCPEGLIAAAGRAARAGAKGLLTRPRRPLAVPTAAEPPTPHLTERG